MTNPDDVYATSLGRHITEVQRLDWQCQLITTAQGWSPHPSIETTLPSNPAIADVATGTARFLRDLAPKYPNARLDGYDISSAMFPSAEILGPQIKLTTLDAKKPFPEELHGIYDLVHVRYLILAMAPTDWEPVLRNLLTLVKPGGWIQWEEPEFLPRSSTRRSLPTTRIKTCKWIEQVFRTPAVNERLAHGWDELPDLMTEAGLGVETDVVSIDRDPTTRRDLITANNIVGVQTLRVLSEKGAPGAKSLEEIDQIAKEAAEEVESGAYCRYDIHTAIGRKPL